MGRKLSEAQKVERAVRRLEARDRAELGPLFAGQAEAVDRRALLYRRRQGQAREVERIHAHLSAAALFLDRLEADHLRRAVVALVGEAEAARLEAHLPGHLAPAYWCDLWKRTLRDRAGVRYTLDDCRRLCSTCGYYHAPGQPACSITHTSGN
jgi:hypothetical protein